MIQRIGRASRRGEAGFTLIELLVVIIVLGILAAVVVFAVTGTGDRGKQAAVDIDDRTIRTAEETFCAQDGRYGTVAELVTAGLLSASSTYNAVFVDSSFGPCNNTSFQVFAAPGPSNLPPIPPGTCTSGTWCSGPLALGTGTSTMQGNRDIGNKVSGPVAMVTLPSGRILVAKSTTNITTGAATGAGPLAPFQVFDPAGGPMGSFTPLPPPNTTGPTTTPGAVPNQVAKNRAQINTMIVLKGGPDWCGSNCGKVLVKFRSDASAVFTPPPNPATSPFWRLYDETTPEPGTQSAGNWTNLSIAPITSGGPYRRVYYTDAVQLTRTPCGAICGQVLIVGQGNEDSGFRERTPADPEIWDPKADQSNPTVAFRKLGMGSGYKEDTGHPQGCGAAGSPGNPPDCAGVGGEGDERAPTLTLLNDGKVLMITGTTAQMFDPLTEKFTDVTPPPYRHSWKFDRALLLADGSVLATSNPFGPGNYGSDGIPRAMIYRPGAGGGTWTVVPSCGDGSPPGTLPNNRWCFPLVQLPDGRVLAKRTGGTSPNRSSQNPNSQPAQIFDPTKVSDPGGPWTTTPAAPIPRSIGWGILISEKRPGSCGNLCGRVLVGGLVPTSGSLSADEPGGTTSIYTP